MVCIIAKAHDFHNFPMCMSMGLMSMAFCSRVDGIMSELMSMASVVRYFLFLSQLIDAIHKPSNPN